MSPYDLDAHQKIFDPKMVEIWPYLVKIAIFSVFGLYLPNAVTIFHIFGLSALAVEAYGITLVRVSVRPSVRASHHIWRSVHQILMFFLA